MTVLSLNTKQKYGTLLAGNSFYDPYAYKSIATVSVGSGGSSSIDFTSIPSTYTHLQIRIMARTTRTAAPVDNLKITFNGDTGTNYYKAHYVYGDGSSVTSSSEGSSTYTKAFRFTTDNSNVSSSSMFGVAIVDILDANSTNKNKTIRCLGGIDCNSTVFQTKEIWYSSGLWYATPAAISSIKLESETGSTIKQYSRFALYGIRSA